MKKTRYTEEQIAFALRQADTGTPVGEVIRKMGISTQTFYRWKKQYGQMGVDEIQRLWTDWKRRTGNSSNWWRI